MKKALKWTGILLGGLLALVLLAVGGFILRDRIRYKDFYGMDQKEMKVPGLWNGYVAQGFDYLEEEQIYLSCGYHKSGKASMIYILDGEEQLPVEMKQNNGSDYTGHTGGIDIYGPYVYITASTGCDLFLLSDVLDGDGVATQVGSVKTCNDPAYCTVLGDVLYVGSFYDPGKYDTPEEHHMTTPAGDENTAILAVYPLDPSTGKPHSEIPSAVYSTTSQVQGMTFAGENIMVLSSSYGLSTSMLRFYDLSALKPSSRTIRIHGNEVPVLFLDSDCLIETVEAPPMAEEIVFREGRILIMNESASTKYWFGKLTSGRYVRSIPLPEAVKKIS